jgi:hypothetical protein
MAVENIYLRNMCIKYYFFIRRKLTHTSTSVVIPRVQKCFVHKLQKRLFDKIVFTKYFLQKFSYRKMSCMTQCCPEKNQKFEDQKNLIINHHQCICHFIWDNNFEKMSTYVAQLMSCESAEDI